MQSAINEGNRILFLEDQLTCLVEFEAEPKKIKQTLVREPHYILDLYLK